VKVLVCVKRVPITGGKIVLTDDAQEIRTLHLGFAVSPHEECAVEEAVRIVEAGGGEVVVLTLGPAEAEEQLRDCMAIGADRGILIRTDGQEWDPQATAAAIVDAGGARDVYEAPLPAVLTVLEGLNLPRYPSVPGRLRAKSKPLAVVEPARPESKLEKLRLVLPEGQGTTAEILGEGAAAAPKVVEVMQSLGVA
jgi:electron transfer flavoprotein beta subunit